MDSSQLGSVNYWKEAEQSNGRLAMIGFFCLSA